MLNTQELADSIVAGLLNELENGNICHYLPHFHHYLYENQLWVSEFIQRKNRGEREGLMLFDPTPCGGQNEAHRFTI